MSGDNRRKYACVYVRVCVYICVANRVLAHYAVRTANIRAAEKVRERIGGNVSLWCRHVFSCYALTPQLMLSLFHGLRQYKINRELRPA